MWFVDNLLQFESISIDFKSIHSIDVPLPETVQGNDKLTISFNAFYSYKKKRKEQHLFLHINDGLAVLGRVDKQLMVKKKWFNLCL